MLYSSVSPFITFHIHDAVVRLVEPPQMNGTEIHGPEAFADLLEAEVFAAEEIGHEHLLTLPANRGVLRDLPNLEMQG